MTPLTALEKRIKRHVIGPEREIFVVTAPGLEHVCHDELIRLPLSRREAAVVPGGIEFNGRLHDCYLANLKLATANRILVRIAHFKANTFHKLYKKIAQFPWELYLAKGSELKLRVSSKQSRLYHKGAVAEYFEKAIARRLGEYCPLPADGSAVTCRQQIFVRIVEDQFTVSLDSSGELLHKRGFKSYRAIAPVRETIAAAILRLAGYEETEPLVDPMCGSGTFSLEAAMMVKHIPPGWFREFAFMGWPGFSPGRWQYLRKSCEAAFALKSAPQIFASDSDEAMCAALRHSVNEHHISDAVQVACRDFFLLDPKDLTDKKGLVILNPPYGMRIAGKANSEEFFKALCSQLKKVYSGWRLALIIPEKLLRNKVPIPGLTKHKLFHGGLKVVLMTGRIPRL
jgi:putative N6-adenine-specific DNA methylase